MGKKSNRKRFTALDQRKKISRKQKTAIGRNRKNNRIKTALKSATQTQKGLSCKRILRLTKGFLHFLGCFAQDTVSQLQFRSKPCFFLVNTDSTGSPGSHWLAIGLFPTTIEVFDPLGFEIFKWSQIPCSLLKFIHTHSVNRKLLLSDKVQSNTSTLCGFYCLFYVLNRPFMSFSQIMSCFSTVCSENDKLLPLLF